MNILESVDIETVLSGRVERIDTDVAGLLSRYPLESIETEYPHHVGSIEDPDAVPRPSEQHPMFYGCFDWHSAVHSHWCLVRQLRLFDDHPEAGRIRELLERRFTAEHVAGEVEYFERNPSFEKPYGWGWFLRLAAELHLWTDGSADRWRETLRPLENRIVALVEDEFLPQDRPFRVGTHHNTAFALQCVLDYARTVGDDSLDAAATATARRFYEDDEDYPVEYEPLGWDFLSPALTEANLLRRVLDRESFVEWFEAFLPAATTPPSDSILEPVDADPSPDDGVELHLVGLNLSKAWCLADLASALEGRNERYAEAFERSARRHAESGLEHAFTDDYAGAHWLSSFVLYLLTRREGGIDPGAR